MPSWSLSRRLILVLTGSLTGLWLLATLASSLVVYHEISEVFDSALQETAQRILPLALSELNHPDDEDRDDREHERTIGDGLSYQDHEEHLVYQIRDRSGRVLLRSHDAQSAPFPIPLSRGFAAAGGWRYYTEMALSTDQFIQVAERLEKRIETVTESLTWLIAPLLLLVPLTAGAIFLTVRRSLQPIGAVREAIVSRSGVNLNPIPDADLPIELRPIVRDVNRLLERLARALENERDFAANSAHELRTPVAAAMAQSQRLEVDLKDTPQQARAAQITRILRRLGKLVERLLQLARADSGIALSREPVDLMPVLTLVIDEFSHAAGGQERIRFDDGGHRTLTARADRDAIGIALRNVIENALLYGANNTPVEVWVDAAHSIHVANEGAVVETSKLAKLTQRFQRGDDGADGSGLGLAIADTIMQQSGGGLSLHSPAIGRDGGFEAVLHLG
jgi:two-component system OmpR family sensor kinase